MKKDLNVNCLGYSIYNGKLSKIKFRDKLVINTINQYSFCIAEKDMKFKEALNSSNILLPDGIGITLAYKFLRNKKIKKIAGADIHQFILKKLNKENGSCYYFGSSSNTLSKIQERITKEYPNIKVGFYSPPYKDEFNNEENKIMIKAINDFQPDVLFVGMTAPKQEKWVSKNKPDLNVGAICSIGAVFDFYAGTVNRPSQEWINLGLEWLGRLLNEPKRMWKRYIYYGVIFMFHLIGSKISSIKQFSMQPIR
ncbi:WecB/TagA/CpsF family glycosyltransferase [Formosa sp. S-31]|uniref:WecB/TagA/CpsF family glycosyltransferase n=1 Tax=Formosa sp. S-31 TaxID=2790949 RepID=UPI003EBA1903